MPPIAKCRGLRCARQPGQGHPPGPPKRVSAKLTLLNRPMLWGGAGQKAKHPS